MFRPDLTFLVRSDVTFQDPVNSVLSVSLLFFPLTVAVVVALIVYPYPFKIDAHVFLKILYTFCLFNCLFLVKTDVTFSEGGGERDRRTVRQTDRKTDKTFGI